MSPLSRPTLTLALVLAPILLPTWGTSARCRADEPAPATDPPSGPRPVEVTVGFFLIDFARINAREETFDLHGYLLARWRDPRLALSPMASPRARRRVKAGTAWAPEFEFLNATEQVKIQRESDLMVEPDGTAFRWIHFGGKFSTPLDLRRFPFDRQKLVVIVEPAEHGIVETTFVVDPKSVLRSPDAFLTDWSIDDISAKVVEHTYPLLGLKAPRFRVEVDVSRRSTFYIWRVLLPLTLLTITSWVIFWFEPTGLQPQISTALSILLSLVVFNFTIDFAQPKVEYLTHLDRHAITSFVFALAGIITVAAIHVVVNRDGAERARRWQRSARWIFPTAYVVVLLLDALIL